MAFSLESGTPLSRGKKSSLVNQQHFQVANLIGKVAQHGKHHSGEYDPNQ